MRMILHYLSAQIASSQSTADAWPCPPLLYFTFISLICGIPPWTLTVFYRSFTPALWWWFLTLVSAFLPCCIDHSLHIIYAFFDLLIAWQVVCLFCSSLSLNPSPSEYLLNKTRKLQLCLTVQLHQTAKIVGCVLSQGLAG